MLVPFHRTAGGTRRTVYRSDIPRTARRGAGSSRLLQWRSLRRRLGWAATVEFSLSSRVKSFQMPKIPNQQETGSTIGAMPSEDGNSIE